MPALTIASILGHIDVVKVLLKVPGVDANFQDKVRQRACPLHAHLSRHPERELRSGCGVQ